MTDEEVENIRAKLTSEDWRERARAIEAIARKPDDYVTLIPELYNVVVRRERLLTSLSAQAFSRYGAAAVPSSYEDGSLGLPQCSLRCDHLAPKSPLPTVSTNHRRADP